MIITKSKRELSKMRIAGRIAAQTLATVVAEIQPGVTTLELDAKAEERIRAAGAIPAFKGYRGFPASLCTSIDSEVVHGIPSSRRLEDGMILSLDVGAIWEGFYGDLAITVPVGEVNDEVVELLNAGSATLAAGIAKVKAGNRLTDISHAIQQEAKARGYAVVRDYAGHGIGREMHEDPQVLNYGQPGRGPELRPGMVLAIEPMLNEGGHQVRVAPDGWTVFTADGRLSVHFEHTVAVTDKGPEILTQCE